MSGSTTDVIVKTYPQGTVERAQYRDLRSINDIVYSAYHPYVSRLDGKSPAPMAANYDSLIATKKVYILRLTSTASIVGCISFSLDATQESLQINNLAVDPAAQGKGYGKLLMRFSEDLAGMMGVKKLELYTNVKMVENIGLYRKLGYVEVGRWEEEGFERVFMRKRLVTDTVGDSAENTEKVEMLKRDLTVAEEEEEVDDGAQEVVAQSSEQVALLRA